MRLGERAHLSPVSRSVPGVNVRVSAFTGNNTPIWRSRAFVIHPHDLGDLLRLAERLEGQT
jgi:hypothetical protein